MPINIGYPKSHYEYDVLCDEFQDQCFVFVAITTVIMISVVVNASISPVWIMPLKMETPLC